MLRQGGAVVVGMAILLSCGSLCPADEDEDGRTWLLHTQKERQAVLSDLMRTVPRQRLCSLMPKLDGLWTEASKASSSELSTAYVSMWEAPLEALDFNVTSETISSAAEKLSKCDRANPLVFEGYAVAAGLLAVDLVRAVRELDYAVGASDFKVEGSSVPDVDSLRVKVDEANELVQCVTDRCPRRTRREILSLTDDPQREAERVIRRHRRAQWQGFAKILWRFRSSLPFMAVGTTLSAVLGALSAVRLHYQSAVISSAQDTVLGTAGSPKRTSIGHTVGAMVVSELICQMTQFAVSRLSTLGKMRVVRELKVSLFSALLRQDLEYLEQCDLWHVRSLIGNCGTMVGRVIDIPLLCAQSGSGLLAALLSLWGRSPQLTVFLAFALPSRVLLTQAVDTLEGLLDQPDVRGQIDWRSLVKPASLRTMRAFAREPVEIHTFARFLSVQDKFQDQGRLIYNLLQVVRNFLEHSTHIAALWYGGRLATRGELDFGDLSSFVLVAEQALSSAQYMRAACTTMYQQAEPLAQMAALLVKTPRIGLDNPPLSQMPDPALVEWRVTFKGVSFMYPQRPGVWVLRDLSFDVKDGEFLGILGTTGAGKSTIFALLLRFYEPTEGEILLDGRDIREYNPLWLRSNVSLVSDELVLCRDTVRENLVYGCVHTSSAELEEPSDEEAREALRVAQCEDTFFDGVAFPNHWHTDIGSEGSQLSSGQRQRLSIARALLKKPRMLLLDEATSALDELSQARLQDALEKMRHGRNQTVICIAHRLSNFARADRLVVLEQGAVVESGKPAELAEADGAFAKYARVHLESLSSKEA